MAPLMARPRNINRRIAEQGVRLAGAGIVLPSQTRPTGDANGPETPIAGPQRPLEADQVVPVALGAPKQSERAFMAQVGRYATLMKWRVWHDNATNAPRRCRSCGEVQHLPRNRSGLPDLILVRRPRVVWVELKADRGKLSDEQRAWLDDLRASGQEVYLWRPNDWSEAERVLR
jgi:hypothetical protein